MAQPFPASACTLTPSGGWKGRSRKTSISPRQHVAIVTPHSHTPQAGLQSRQEGEKSASVLKKDARFDSKLSACMSVLNFSLCYCRFAQRSGLPMGFYWSVGHRELINGLLQRPDTRAGLQLSVSMCLLFDGWCFNILNLNRRRSAWWGLPYGYSGAQPGAPQRWGVTGKEGDRKTSSVWHHNLPNFLKPVSAK